MARRFFDRAERELLAAVCETILPRTDTPGALDAGVHVFIEASLAVSPATTRNAFRRGLRAVDRVSRTLFRRAFQRLSRKDQGVVLRGISRTDPDFFRNLKDRTIHAYYTSEIGLLQELGTRAHDEDDVFAGCSHDGDDHSR